jgi:hypothetical protein
VVRVQSNVLSTRGGVEWRVDSKQGELARYARRPADGKMLGRTIFAKARAMLDSAFINLSGRHLLALLLLLLTSGCAVQPWAGWERDPHPAVTSPKGFLVMVDACVKQDALSSEESHLLVEESIQIAQRDADALTAALAVENLTAKAVIVPFACGMQGDIKVVPERAALRAGTPAFEGLRPFGVVPASAGADEAEHAAYVKALSLLSTYAFYETLAFARTQQNKPAVPFPKLPDDEAAAALALVTRRHDVDGILYVGSGGISQTAGKVAMGIAGRALLSGLILVATGGTLMMFYTGGQGEGRTVIGAVFDTRDPALVRTAYRYAPGDPRKPAVMLHPAHMSAVVKELMYRPPKPAK